MQLKNNISFPVNLGTTQWGTASLGGLVYLYTGDGQCPITCNWSSAAGGYPCTVNFNLVWINSNQFALQVADNQSECYAPQVGCYGSFSTHNGYLEAVDSTISQESTFGLENLGGGNVAITFKVGPGQFAYLNGTNNWHDWGFNVIMYGLTPQPPDQSTIFTTGHPQFHILLISGSGFGLDITGQNFADGGYIHSIADTDFTGANLTNANLSTLPDLSVAGCNFTRATLTGAILTGVQNLNKATWKGANLTDTDLSQVDPKGVTGIDFSTATLTGAKLSNGKPLSGNLKYGSAKFNRSNLTNAHMASISCQSADFTGATLTGADLTGADLTNADLTGADLTGTKLAGTILTGATLSGTIFDDCDVSTTIFGPAPRFGSSVDTRTRFRSANVSATGLGSNWSYIDLTGANIVDIPKSIVNFIADGALLPLRLNLQEVDLANGSFQGAQMYGIQLQNANLCCANLRGALMQGANLNQANLTSANLTNAWLIVRENVELGDANKRDSATAVGAFMFNTILDGAHCDGVDFSRATFVTAEVIGPQQASAVGAFMNLAKFNSAYLEKAVFNGAQLSGANFSDSSMIGASFQNNGTTPTQLQPYNDNGAATNSSVSGAHLEGADFTGANMDGVDMSGSYTSVGSGPFQKEFTNYDKKSKVPVSFTYDNTKLGNLTTSSICPNGNNAGGDPPSCALGEAGT